MSRTRRVSPYRAKIIWVQRNSAILRPPSRVEDHGVPHVRLPTEMHRRQVGHAELVKRLGSFVQMQH